MESGGQLVSAELLARRNATPSMYPCISQLGIYKSGSTKCSKACCVVQPSVKTPSGEDSPKWSAALAARMEAPEPIAQPDFGDFGSPDKTSPAKEGVSHPSPASTVLSTPSVGGSSVLTTPKFEGQAGPVEVLDGAYSPTYATGLELEDRKRGIFKRERAGDDDDAY